ncbi:MAG: hypothetical protein KDK70_01105 [Myxococcales bacterium]|nr:hypothetical protein [Myxococcales bacterium]
MASLRDGRRIIHDGEQIEDVTTHPDFAWCASAVAQFYDFQSDPAARDVMTYQTPDGTTAGTAFMEPQTQEDLRRRATAHATWAEVTCGFMGRSPDYMNTCLATIAGVSRALAESDPATSERARRLYLTARDDDLAYTHTFAEPFKVATSNQPSCRIVRETSDGIVVSGARILATLAPFCNMNLDLPGSVAYERNGASHALGFVVPVNADGITWLMRESVVSTRTPRSDSLSGRMDEMDCIAILDECLIPWDQVYVVMPDDIRLPWFPLMMAGLHHHVVLRAIAKTRFMVGLAHLLAESSRVNRFTNVQERLGEMATILHTMEAFAMAAVEGAIYSEDAKQLFPHPKTVETAVTMFGHFHETLVSHIYDVAGSRLMSCPHERTVDLASDVVEQYFRGSTTSGHDNIALHRLAWDVTGSSWGSRQDLYERFHFGNTTMRRLSAYASLDKEQVTSAVRRVLSQPPDRTTGRVWPLPNPRSSG